LISRLDALTKSVTAELNRQGFKGARLRAERMLNMRFDGTDTALMILCEGDEIDTEDFEAAFKREYKKEFGFLLEAKIVVDDVKVCARD
jgi:5-oxoprolinase (ATP-hydrolysing)